MSEEKRAEYLLKQRQARQRKRDAANSENNDSAAALVTPGITRNSILLYSYKYILFFLFKLNVYSAKSVVIPHVANQKSQPIAHIQCTLSDVTNASLQQSGLTQGAHITILVLSNMY